MSSTSQQSTPVARINSRRKSPRIQTLPPIAPNGTVARIPKRIIVCCDGTWQDGILSTQRWQYTNILKLSRSISHQDDRQNPAIPQILFYQAGVGSNDNVFSEIVDGATGASLGGKVEEAYAFISHNYQQGDEIYLFGFSRGAYTARMVAAFIGEIGVLDRTDMDHFAVIFITYQKWAKSTDKKEIEKLQESLAPFTSPKSRGRLRADADGDRFTIKCLGVFDTVGAIGLPEELRISRKAKRMFGFPDKVLGAHVENAFQAMALNETRADFDIAKFEQTELGRRKGQVLRQVWFSGAHTDIGGGYQSHDLSDITLAWMASNVEHMLSLDQEYLKGIPTPIAPWGEQPPHDPETGIYLFSLSMKRALPTATTDITHEYIHPSVLAQPGLSRQLKDIIDKNPALVCRLNPLEEQFKATWLYVPGKNVPKEENAKTKSVLQGTFFSRARTIIRMRRVSAVFDEEMDGGRSKYVRSRSITSIDQGKIELSASKVPILGRAKSIVSARRVVVTSETTI